MTTLPDHPAQTVLVIDDHPLLRKGIIDLIAMDDTLKVAGEAADGRQGLALARALQPDMVVLDLNMPDTGGLETLQAIKTANPDVRVIVFTVSDCEEDVVAALRAGADGYLLKDMEPEDMLAQLRSAADGRLVLSPQITERLAHALRGNSQPRSPASAELTGRECDILRLIAAGNSNKLIARALNITEGTVKVHVKHLLKKLNLRSRVEAAVWAMKNGFGA